MEQQISQLSKKAANHFRQGYNCAQSVLLTMQEYYGTRRDSLIPKIATAFGGGIGRCGSLCGALTGAVMSIGLRYGTNEPFLEKREEAYRLARELYEQFEKEFSSPFCRELIGYDLTRPEELERARESKALDEKCTCFVKKAVEILISLEK